jgi:tRNA dimethylallyltransferase
MSDATTSLTPSPSVLQPAVHIDLSRIRVLAIVGPTGVGKTELAEEVAVRLGTEIVSADSMQVYRGMDIGTAKPPVASRRVAYWCLDLVNPGSPYSAALYQQSAREAIVDIAARSMVPVVAGGTGLYVRAALDDLSFPKGDQKNNAVRKYYEDYAEAHGAPALYEVLLERDPDSAAVIHRNNTRRVVRALEMLDGGVPYAEQRAGFSTRNSVYDAVFVGLSMDRDRLYRRIDDRVDAMVAAGLLGEIAGLLEAGLRAPLTATQAIGYKEFVPVVDGKADLDEAVIAVKQATRRYAKRQITWFRADPRVIWIKTDDLSLSEAADEVLRAIDCPSATGTPGAAARTP